MLNDFVYAKYLAYGCLYVNSLPSAHPQIGSGLGINITNSASQVSVLNMTISKCYRSHS